jgi:hypothetical protein
LVSISRNATNSPILPYVKGFMMWGV